MLLARSDRNTFNLKIRDFSKTVNVTVSWPSAQFWQLAGFQCDAPPLLLNTLLRSFWQDAASLLPYNIPANRFFLNEACRMKGKNYMYIMCPYKISWYAINYTNKIYGLTTQWLFFNRQTQCLDVMASGSVRTAPEPCVRRSLIASNKPPPTILISDKCGTWK